MSAEPLRNLDAATLGAALTDLPGWSITDAALVRRFEFDDFNTAFGFMTRVALWAEKHDHHPDWRNVWSRVDVRLTTHDTGGITARDLALAQVMSALAGS